MNDVIRTIEQLKNYVDFPRAHAHDFKLTYRSSESPAFDILGGIRLSEVPPQQAEIIGGEDF